MEIAALGGLVRATFPIADAIREAADRGGERAPKLDVDQLEKLQYEGVRIGLGEFRARLAKSVDEMQQLVRATKR
jgi:hypothetical protein